MPIASSLPRNRELLLFGRSAAVYLRAVTATAPTTTASAAPLNLPSAAKIYWKRLSDRFRHCCRNRARGFRYSSCDQQPTEGTMEIKLGKSPEKPRKADAFALTDWALLDAVRDSAAIAPKSLGQLCQSYWYPVYAYVRRWGFAPEVAYDTTQAFFGHLIEAIRHEDAHSQGQFRQFLLTKLGQFLREDWRSERALPAGSELPVPMAFAEVEARVQRERQEGTPERSFQRGFALEVVGRGMQRLRAEAVQNGRLALFELLEPFLTCEPEPLQYQVLTEKMHAAGVAVAMAINRLRRRFRELVDDELAATLTSADDLDAERGALLAILGEAR